MVIEPRYADAHFFMGELAAVRLPADAAGEAARYVNKASGNKHPRAHGREVRRRQRLTVRFPQQRQALPQPGRKRLASGTLPEVPFHFRRFRGCDNHRGSQQ